MYLWLYICVVIVVIVVIVNSSIYSLVNDWVISIVSERLTPPMVMAGPESEELVAGLLKVVVTEKREDVGECGSGYVEVGLLKFLVSFSIASPTPIEGKTLPCSMTEGKGVTAVVVVVTVKRLKLVGDTATGIDVPKRLLLKLFSAKGEELESQDAPKERVSIVKRPNLVLGAADAVRVEEDGKE